MAPSTTQRPSADSATEGAAGSARLFFALWPAPPVAGALDRAGRELHLACGGRRTRRDNIHLTLVFLGNVELFRMEALRAVAQAVRVPRFRLVLDSLAWWRHNRVAWAGSARTPEPLAQLVTQLQDGLRAVGIRFDERPVYVPHVTLVRNARCEGVALPALPALRWDAEDFVLVRSVTREEGAAYEAIGRWPLRGERGLQEDDAF